MSDENTPMADEPSDEQVSAPVEEPAGGPEAAPKGGAGSGGEEWKAVVAELNALGEAISRWVTAAVADEDNKRRVAEFRERIEGYAAKVGDVAKDAVDSEVGKSFKEAADKTGEAFRKAGDKVSEEAAPKAASAFRGFADKLRDAAERLEKQADQKGEVAAGDATPASDAADAADDADA